MKDLQDYSVEERIKLYWQEIARLSSPCNPHEALRLKAYQTMLEAAEDALGEE
ncbi:MAG: hypothetical protein RPU73_05680 [Candidatus Sedimenticola sp. (ex Thyasira tokunagai)]